jgi:hypothetical protein
MPHLLTLAAAAVLLFFPIGAEAEDPAPGLVVSVLDADGQAVTDFTVYSFNLSAGEESGMAQPVRVDATGRLTETTNGQEPLQAGAYAISVTLGGAGGATEMRFAYVAPGERTTLLIQMPQADKGKAELVAAATAAARSGDGAAYQDAKAGLESQLDNEQNSAANAAATAEQFQEEVLSDPHLRGTGQLRRDLENAQTPFQKAEIIQRHEKAESKKLDKIDKTMGVTPEARAAVRRLGHLGDMFGSQSSHEQRAAKIQDMILRLPPLQTKPAYEPGSMNPAGPGQFYATFGTGLEYANLPDFGYVHFADFQNQIILRRNVVSDKLDDDVGFGVELGGGYVLADPFFGDKNSLDLTLGYANVDSDYQSSAKSTNADQEFWGPAGVGFSLLGPNGGLRDVNLNTRYRNLDLTLRLASDLPPCGGNITLTPIAGIVYRRVEFDAAMTLDAGSVKVARRDELTSNAGGYELGLYASKPFGRITLYSGVHTSGLYQDAEGHSRLVASGGASFFERRNLSKDGFVVDVGGALGLRYDWKDWLSLGIEGNVDWTNGALSVEYPKQEGRPAKLDFESGFGSSLAVKVTVPLSF